MSGLVRPHREIVAASRRFTKKRRTSREAKELNQGKKAATETLASRLANPAGVIIDANSLSSSQMLGIAAEADQSETAFVSASQSATLVGQP